MAYKVLHKRSNQTQGGGAKLPSASTLQYGEIAVNYHKGSEKLVIKNDDDNIQTFRGDNQLPPVEKHTEQEFVYRKSVNTNESQSMVLDKIHGKTLAWNQLVDPNGRQPTHSHNGVTFTRDAGVTISLSGTANDMSETPYLSYYQILTNGHKYLAFGCPRGGDASSYRMNFWIHNSVDFLGTETGNGFIFTYQESFNNLRPYITIPKGVNTNGLVFYLVLYDLTLMFGSGNEPSTPEDFNSMFPNAYYPYNPGTLISNDAESIETVGFNIFDEVVVSGLFNVWGNGEENANADYVRSVNFMSCLPGTVYYFKGDGGKGYRILFYDANKTYLGSDAGFVETVNNTATAPASARYMRVYYPVTSTSPHCINISDSTKNGTYEPYRKSTMQLGLNSIKVKSHNIWDEEWENGVILQSNGQLSDNSDRFRSKNFIPVKPSTKYYNKSVLNVVISAWGADHSYLGVITYTNNTEFTTPSNCYYIKFYTGENQSTYQNDICINVSSSFNGQYEPHGDITIIGGLKSAGSVKDEIAGNKYIKRVGEVDLGTLIWRYSSGGIFYAPVPGGKGISIACMYQAAIEDKYAYSASEWSLLPDKCFGFGENVAGGNYGSVYINDSAYSDAATFKTAMSGVTLYYELATTIEYELVTPLNASVKAGTTEARISPNSDGLSAPMVADISYTQGYEYILGEVSSQLGDVQSILQTI